MTRNHGNQVKKDDTYEKLREKGESKEKAARIANAQANARQKPSEKGGKGAKYEDRSRAALYAKAREVGIARRSYMNKSELITALRKH